MVYYLRAGSRTPYSFSYNNPKEREIMIQNEKTFEKFGYYGDLVTAGSNKLVVLSCDYCGKDFDKVMKVRKKAHKDIAKDCCSCCKYSKIEEINMLRYNCKNQFQRKEIMDKVIPLHSERLRTQDFKDKRSKTCIEKYGTDNMMLVPEIADRIKATTKDRYGFEYAGQNENIKAQIRKTNLSKYGNESFLASDIGKKAVMDAVIEKYGVDNVFKLESVKEKIRETYRKKYGVEHHLKVKSRAKKHALEVLESRIKNGTVQIYMGMTIRQLSEFSEYSFGRFKDLVKIHGFEDALTMSPRISSLEAVMATWLQELRIEFHKEKIGSRSPDFVVEDYSMIVECDGNYFHSNIIQKDDHYHSKKRDYYKSLGYNSIFFREDEIVEKIDAIKSIILQRTLTKEVVSNFSVNLCINNNIRSFLEENSLSLPLLCCDNLMMHSGDEKIAIIQHEGNVITRFCVKPGYDKADILSKFLYYFDTSLGMVIHLDRRFDEEDYLESLGFSLKSCEPTYCWTDGNIRMDKSVFSEEDGVNEGYHKIWDCGQAIYVKPGRFNIPIENIESWIPDDTSDLDM